MSFIPEIIPQSFIFEFHSEVLKLLLHFYNNVMKHYCRQQGKQTHKRVWGILFIGMDDLINRQAINKWVMSHIIHQTGHPLNY